VNPIVHTAKILQITPAPGRLADAQGNVETREAAEERRWREAA
jgi:hypothetical protein